MKKEKELFKRGEPDDIYSFKIIDENAPHLKLFFLDAAASSCEQYRKWFENKHGIQCQVDAEGQLGLVFKSTEMSVRIALYILKSGQPVAKYRFKAIDLAKFILRSHPFIDSKKCPALFAELKKILIEMTTSECDNFRSMNQIALRLGMHSEILPAAQKLNSNNHFETSYKLLEGIIQLLSYSNQLCRRLLDRMDLVKSDCNEIAYRAVVAVERITQINNEYPGDIDSLIKMSFSRDVGIIERIQQDAKLLLLEYLRKFKFPEYFLLNWQESKKDNQKKRYDSLDYDALHIFKIDSSDISALSSIVVSLDQVRKTAEMILTTYNQIQRFFKNTSQLFAERLPEQSDLLSPLFHHYNSQSSPLISAIVDSKLNQLEHLSLFRDLARTLPYQQSKPNISIYGEGGGFRGEFMSPLCYAVERAIPEVVRIILEQGATVNPIDNRKAPLHRAMTRGNLDIVKLLLQFGARPDLVTDDDGTTALHYSEDPDCAAYLIEWIEQKPEKFPKIHLESFINAHDHYGCTPLHRICQKKVLVVSRFDRNTQLSDRDQKSQRHLGLISVFLDKGADVNAVTKAGYSALHFVIMVNNSNRFNEVDLLTVFSSVKMLVDAGADVNHLRSEKSESFAKKPYQVFTPLLGLFDRNYLGNINAYSSQEMVRFYLHQVAEVLVDHGASINVFDEQLKTPLIKSVISSAASAVKLLLERGADPNLRANKGMLTPLHYAMRINNEQLLADERMKSLEYLLSVGASPRLLVEKAVDLKYENRRNMKTLTINAYTMQLILSQDNEISQCAKILDMSDKNESIEERFLRAWTALDMKTLKIPLKLNPLEYSRTVVNIANSVHPKAIELFHEWFNFYQSTDVKNLIDCLCLDACWSMTPKDLVICFAIYFSNNTRQVKLLQDWILRGRNIANSRAVSQDTVSVSALSKQGIFAVNNSPLSDETCSITALPETLPQIVLEDHTCSSVKKQHNEGATL